MTLKNKIKKERKKKIKITDKLENINLSLINSENLKKLLNLYKLFFEKKKKTKKWCIKVDYTEIIREIVFLEKFLNIKLLDEILKEIELDEEKKKKIKDEYIELSSGRKWKMMTTKALKLRNKIVDIYWKDFFLEDFLDKLIKYEIESDKTDKTTTEIVMK